jgi:hypothetical protein
MTYGPASECPSKARERLQVLLRIRPRPSARRITAESQSQRRQAPLRIGSYSSSDQWIMMYSSLWGRVLNGSELRHILDKISIIKLAHSLHKLPDTISDLDRVLYTYSRLAKALSASPVTLNIGAAQAEISEAASYLHKNVQTSETELTP